MTALAHWEAGGIEAGPAAEWDPLAGVAFRAFRTAVLRPELARSLAWWLLGYVGDRAAPADPDRVRVAVDEARAELRRRSAATDTTDDFRAGLAWCDHHLDTIAQAAS